jgi:hypothetical protein
MDNEESRMAVHNNPSPNNSDTSTKVAKEQGKNIRRQAITHRCDPPPKESPSDSMKPHFPHRTPFPTKFPPQAQFGRQTLGVLLVASLNPVLILKPSIMLSGPG